MLSQIGILHVLESVLYAYLTVQEMVSQQPTLRCLLYATAVIRLVTALLQLKWHFLREADRRRETREPSAGTSGRADVLPADTDVPAPT
ncbi:MAG TPA: hypothetical protein VGD67_15080 [Pseudonocardiaceae bacterium]